MEGVYVSAHPLIRHKLTVLRDVTTPPIKFRQVVREISMLLCYEATQDLVLKGKHVDTPLAPYNGDELADRMGLVPILRAGLGMVDGVLEMVPEAEVWHIGLYRDEETLRPVEYYNKLPEESHVQICFILDPMLATGGSATATAQIVKDWGAGRIKFLGVIAAPEGIAAMREAHPDIDLHVAAIDDRLNDVGFIVPGLGDAGDRQFGTG
ncbi:MAG: uracil phosphoribosyltransferase [Chloroflexi bacterium]|nr:uracil phosphoribosyltransferase [Chloroflexota bacterium]